MVLKTVRGGYDGRGVVSSPPRLPRPARRPRNIWPTGWPILVEDRVAMRRNSRRWSPARRSGRGRLAGGGNRSAPKAFASKWRRPPLICAGPGRRGGRAGPAVGHRTGRGRRAGRRTVRDRRRPAAGQRTGRTAAQLRALDHGRRRHLAVRAAPAGGARHPLGDTAARADVTVMANVLGARKRRPIQRRRAASTTCSPHARRQRCTCTARGAGRPQARPRQHRRDTRRGCCGRAGTRQPGGTLVVARNGPTDGTGTGSMSTNPWYVA